MRRLWRRAETPLLRDGAFMPSDLVRRRAGELASSVSKTGLGVSNSLMSFDTLQLNQTHSPVPHSLPPPGRHLPLARGPRLDWQYSKYQQMKY